MSHGGASPPALSGGAAALLKAAGRPPGRGRARPGGFAGSPHLPRQALPSHPAEGTPFRGGLCSSQMLTQSLRQGGAAGELAVSLKPVGPAAGDAAGSVVKGTSAAGRQYLSVISTGFGVWKAVFRTILMVNSSRRGLVFHSMLRKNKKKKREKRLTSPRCDLFCYIQAEINVSFVRVQVL